MFLLVRFWEWGVDKNYKEGIIDMCKRCASLHLEKLCFNRISKLKVRPWRTFM